MCINIRSLVNSTNFAKLEAFICNLSSKPDIIYITETWAQSYVSGAYNNLDGYNFVSNCRKLSKGGGVGICIKNFINFSIISNLTIMVEKKFESIVVNLDLHGNCVKCRTIYKPPNTNPEHHNLFLNTLEL